MRFTFVPPQVLAVPMCYSCNPHWTCAEHHASGVRTRIAQHSNRS